MSGFFIDRPIFAWVIAILIMLGGVLAIVKLPVTQYPDVAAPAISVTGSYPGASAQTVQDTVVQIIEQQMNGLDGFRYISSDSSADGSFTVVITFDQGTDPDIAQVQVQNKLQLATPMLPGEVQSQGLSVAKYQVNFMAIAALYSEDGRLDSEFLGDYLISNLRDPISRTRGVGEVMGFGSQYAMRIWLDPEKLHSYQLMPSDVIAAVSNQNVQISAGQLGGLPTLGGVQLNATVAAKSKLTRAEDFEELLLKVNPDTSQVRLRDVATVALGGENYGTSAKYNGFPASALAIRMAAGANVLETTAAVKETVRRLEPFLPAGVKAAFPYETAPSVQTSISAVVHTLVEAVVLVFLIMYLFLQNFRATIIPTLAVPVVLLGTFGVLFAFGYSINVITMFAMVLAIGLLVDDAIVVVENVERLMMYEGLSPREATRKSMDQIQGALVGIGLVIGAVFFPMAFFAGSTGVIYRQFSITIIAAMGLSVVIALVFTPALCAGILRPHAHHERAGFLFTHFNHLLLRGTEKYARGVGTLLRRKRLGAALALGLFAAVALLFPLLPTAFLPEEDQGNLLISVQLPPNASAERAGKVLDEINGYLLRDEAGVISSTMAISGFSFAGRGQNVGMIFATMKPFAERAGDAPGLSDLAGRAWRRFGAIADATIIPVIPPSIPELGNATGFDFYLQDQGRVGHKVLMNARNRFLGLAAGDPSLAMVRPNGLDDQPQYKVVIDDEKARSFGINLSDINSTMSVAWGSAYVNDFIDQGRVKKVFVQGQAAARIAPEDFGRWHVRNQAGGMVSFAALAEGRWEEGSPKLSRYNGVESLEILGQGAPGVSTGEAMRRVEELARELPPGVAVSFTGLSYEERMAGGQTGQLYVVSLLIVFLCLAALYESWSIPASVMLVVPLGVLGAVLANLARGLHNDVFFQVGLLTVIGLAAKNAILIVEFAKTLHENEGRSLAEAAVEAAKLRLRPILMTSLAFVFGVLPMALASGASAASQRALGTAVVGGTLAATALGVFFVPLFYVLVAGLNRREKTVEQPLPISEPEPEVGR